MFDLERIVRIVGGEFCGRKVNCELTGVSTDSRNMVPGALFVPLRGGRFDGHDYLSQAVKNGAAACLSEEVVEGLNVPVVRVADTLRALGDIAAAHRFQLQGPLIAITGSAGKTTTKEMLAGILTQVAPGLKTFGNFNNLIGLPLTLLRIEKTHQWAVIEMGTSALGEIERLTEIAQPTIGVITNIGEAHLETLHGLDGVSRAKGELYAGLKGGTAIINLDDERVAQLPVANGVKKRTYGLNARADVRGEHIVVEPDAVCFELLTAGQRRMVRLPVPGVHNVHNALAAAAAALELDVSLEHVVHGLEEFVPVQGRMNLFPLASGGMLLDDSYNSNPLSARSALDALNALKGQGRKIAILGDMLELGEDAQVLHQALGERVAQVADLLIAVGRHGEQLERGALKAGMRKEQIYKAAHVAEAIELVKNCHRTGDRLLVKGSRGVQLDRLVQELKSAGPDSAQRKG